MKEKQTFMPRNIYFGKVTYNAGSDGYYTTNTEAFEKFINESDEIMYRKLSKPTKAYKEHTKNTKQYLTVSDLCPMTALMKEEKHNQPVSVNMINLYLLKYQVKEMFTVKTIEDVNLFTR